MVLRLIVYLIDGINVVASSHMTIAYAYADIKYSVIGLRTCEESCQHLLC